MKLLGYLLLLPLFAFACGAVMLTALLVAACVGPAIRTVRPHLDDE